ncbi:MAG: hypothetical protein Kow0031_38940 [Anaerolineae bacterium]
MSTLQKSIIAGLVIVSCVVFGLIAGAAALWLSGAATPPGPAPVEAANPAPTPTPAALARAEATAPPATDTPRPPPTLVPTRVVVGTPAPTPSPTPANCINHVVNFADSGALDDAQVQQFLDRTIPANHLDHCRRIEYIHKLAAVHGTDIAGNFIPIDRKIFVYAISLQGQQPQELLATLLHEIGHNVFFNRWREDFQFEQRWIALYKQGDGYVSAYARSSYMEDFAESYLAYIVAPADLQRVSPAKYQFMRDEVFAGQEY